MEQPTQIRGHSTRWTSGGSTICTEWPLGGVRTRSQRGDWARRRRAHTRVLLDCSLSTVHRRRKATPCGVPMGFRRKGYRCRSLRSRRSPDTPKATPSGRPWMTHALPWLTRCLRRLPLAREAFGLGDLLGGHSRLHLIQVVLAKSVSLVGCEVEPPSRLEEIPWDTQAFPNATTRGCSGHRRTPGRPRGGTIELPRHRLIPIGDTSSQDGSGRRRTPGRPRAGTTEPPRHHPPECRRHRRRRSRG